MAEERCAAPVRASTAVWRWAVLAGSDAGHPGAEAALAGIKGDPRDMERGLVRPHGVGALAGRRTEKFDRCQSGTRMAANHSQMLTNAVTDPGYRDRLAWSRR